MTRATVTIESEFPTVEAMEQLAAMGMEEGPHPGPSVSSTPSWPKIRSRLREMGKVLSGR